MQSLIGQSPSKIRQYFIAKDHRKQVIKILKPKLDLGKKICKALYLLLGRRLVNFGCRAACGSVILMSRFCMT